MAKGNTPSIYNKSLQRLLLKWLVYLSRPGACALPLKQAFGSKLDSQGTLIQPTHTPVSKKELAHIHFTM